ncbi:MAG: hypothetical protein ABW044_02140 [Cellvibrio sp.]
MTSTTETDYKHANARGNGPKERMEGGDQTDDIDINDPETRKKHLMGIKYHAIKQRLKTPSRKPT